MLEIRSLVVEDDPIARRVLVGILSRFGPCLAAEDGEGALEVVRICLAEDKPLDLVCLDIELPGSSGHVTRMKIRGLESAAGLARDERACVVMATNSRDSAHVQQSFVTDDCDGFMIKPLDHDKVLRMLRRLGYR